MNDKDVQEMTKEWEPKIYEAIEKFALSLPAAEKEQLAKIDPHLFGKIFQAGSIFAIEALQQKSGEKL